MEILNSTKTTIINYYKENNDSINDCKDQTNEIPIIKKMLLINLLNDCYQF
jgi:hypothetical protein